MNTKRFGIAAFVAVGSMALLSAAAIAQPPGGGPPPGGGGGRGFGGFQMSPEWKKYNEQHKHLRELSQLMGRVEKLNQDDENKFSKPQSAKMLSLLSKNSAKKSLSEDDANALIKSVNGLMTTKQIKKMATFTDMRGGRPGGGAGAPGGGRPGGGGPPGGGFGGGRPGGGGPPGGAFKMPEVPKTGYNPLNPDTIPMERQRTRAKKGLDDFKAELSKQSK